MSTDDNNRKEFFETYNRRCPSHFMRSHTYAKGICTLCSKKNSKYWENTIEGYAYYNKYKEDHNNNLLMRKIMAITNKMTNANKDTQFDVLTNIICNISTLNMFKESIIYIYMRYINSKDRIYSQFIPYFIEKSKSHSIDNITALDIIIGKINEIIDSCNNIENCAADQSNRDRLQYTRTAHFVFDLFDHGILTYNYVYSYIDQLTAMYSPTYNELLMLSQAILLITKNNKIAAKAKMDRENKGSAITKPSIDALIERTKKYIKTVEKDLKKNVSTCFIAHGVNDALLTYKSPY